MTLPATMDHIKAVADLAPEAVKRRFLEVPPDLFQLTDEELEARNPGGKFSTTLHRLRISFWAEHARAMATLQQMNMTNVYAGICSKENFYIRVLPDKVKTAYMLLPPTEYTVAAEEALLFGLDKLRDMMSVAFQEFKDSKDPKMLDVFRKIVEMLDLRVKGAVIQRVEQKNLNVHVDAKNDVKNVEAIDMDDLDRKLKELESSEIDVTG